MSLLGAVYYDPASTASKATSSLLAMTAVDTTNLRVTFTTPASLGTSVLVRIRGGTLAGATTTPQILLGVLDGSTVKARMSPVLGRGSGTSAGSCPTEATFLVKGLTNNTSYTWDAAYGVEFAVASTSLKYGGPDDTTANNAFGAFGLEVWSTETLLAGKMYDPSTVANTAFTATTVMTAFDTTNLRLTFTAPASGNVMVRLRGVIHGGTTIGAHLLGILDGSAIRGRLRAVTQLSDTGVNPISTDHIISQSRFIIYGLTPSASYTWDAAYSVDGLVASSNLSYGGPDNTSQDDAYGGFAYDIWDAGGSGADETAYAIGQVF